MGFSEDSKSALLNKAIEILKNGGVIIFPTDTVYGFLADAGNKKAVEKIFKIKKRPKTKPLAVFVKDIKMAKKLAEISAEQKKILKKYWPGKFTFVLKRKPDINFYGMDKNTIALRIPKYKLLNDLLEKINKPLVQTSVNISGKPPMAKIIKIKNFFRPKAGISLVIDVGDLLKFKPSAIMDLTKNKIKFLRK